MTPCFVVAHRRDWPYDTPGATVLTAREYLDDSRGATGCGDVVNLCKTYRYQSRGYYVSLLAEARGHRPLPDVRTLEDLHQSRLLRLLTEGLDEPIQRLLADEPTCTLELDALFGASADGAHDALARLVFETLRLPLLRVRFERDVVAAEPAGGSVSAEGRASQARRRRWRIADAAALGPGQVRLEDRPRLARAAVEWVACQARDADARSSATHPGRRPSIAILHDPRAADPPSNAEALRRFATAAESIGMRCTLLGPGDIDRLAEFDALFIRDTTHVAHYTYRFARRAAALGLVVMDDPDSILRCTNKVYLHELLTRHGVPVPRTLQVHAGNIAAVAGTLGLPCILKRPDSAFSLGVKKAADPAELERVVGDFLRDSDLVVAQEFLPTAFDWRVGVLDGRPLFACKYFMAPGHWQVIKREPQGSRDDGRPGEHAMGRTEERDEERIEGRTAAVALADVPPDVLDTAVRAARLLGDGLYGVDLKAVDGRVVVIEVNDNPNVDAGNEDAVTGDALYLDVMRVFFRRLQARDDTAGTDAIASSRRPGPERAP